MSTNPAFSLIMGVVDLPLIKNLDDEVLYVLTEAKLKRPSEKYDLADPANQKYKRIEKTLGNDIYFISDTLHIKELNTGQILTGYKVDGLPYQTSNNMLYALASLYPEFRVHGFKELPGYSEEDASDCLDYWWQAMLDDEKDYAEIQENQPNFTITGESNYLYYGQYQVENWAFTAEYLFSLIGCTVPAANCRLFLDWDWH